MSCLGYDQLKVQGIDALQSIEQLTIDIEPNRHARITLRGLLNEKAGAAYLEDKLENQPVTLVSTVEKEQPLFTGQIVEARVVNDKGVFHLELEGLSGTVKLDLKPHSRSFQNTGLTYQQVVSEVIKDIPHCIAKYQVGRNDKIQAPIIQYLEKDWDFIRRMASHFGAVVVPDVASAYPRFWFGMPEGESFDLEQEVDYQVTRDFGRFQELGGSAAGYRPEDFLTYQVRTGREFAIGDQIKFKGKQLVVGAKKGRMEKGLWVYTYAMGYTPAFGLKKRYNNKISGMSLQGKVLETKGERLKVHLDIDQSQDPGTAYAYPWVPTSGNMMYCMPQVGTKVVLYFPNEYEGQARITGCVRTNGAECEATGDPNNRYFNTEHGKQLALKPAELSLAATGNEANSLRMAMLDDTGIMFENPKKLQLFAKDKIEFTSDKWIKLESMKSFDVSKMDFTTGTPTSLLAMKYECNLWPRVRIEASTRDALEVKKPKQFNNWKFGIGIALGVLGVAVAVAAVVFLAPLVLPALAATAVSGMAIAAGAAGVIGVVSKAREDYKKREDSNWGAFFTTGLCNAIGGAISAIPGEGLLMAMTMNAVGGFVGAAAENTLNSVCKFEEVTLSEALSDTAYSTVGSAFGGGFSYGATKGIQKYLVRNFSKMTVPEAKAFIRGYSKDFGQTVLKYWQKSGLKPGAQTVIQGAKRWEGRLALAYTNSKKELITDLGAKEASTFGKYLPKLNNELIEQMQKNPEILSEALFVNSNPLVRGTNDLIGNPIGSCIGNQFKAEELPEADQPTDDKRSTANNSLLVKGAMLNCSCGSKESPTQLAMCHGVYLTGIPAMAACNKKTMENIMEFGNCKNMHGNQCVPQIVGDWNQSKNDLIINDFSAITVDSWITCSKRGIIKVRESGQKIK
jgi:hypothetical protein